MNMHSFREGLQDRIGKDCAVRPFVCNGNPYDCKAFIVGINAASVVPFWCFWNDKSGFNQDDWYDKYNAEREEKGHRSVSNTRRRIECIVEAAKPASIFETNLFCVATPRACDLRNGDKQTRGFEYMLEEISPKLILLHGKTVKEYFDSKYGCSNLMCNFVTKLIYKKPVAVAAVRHLSRMSYDDASKLGEKIRSVICSTGIN